MQSTWSRPIPLSRAAWLRAADAVADAAHAIAAALHAWWLRRQAARRRAAELQALQQLSPHVLRDIGADPEWVHAAQRWREHDESARGTLLRGL